MWIKAWYDGHQHLWAIQVQDAGGDRVGEVQYAPTPFSMYKVIEDLKKQYLISEEINDEISTPQNSDGGSYREGQ